MRAQFEGEAAIIPHHYSCQARAFFMSQSNSFNAKDICRCSQNQQTSPIII